MDLTNPTDRNTIIKNSSHHIYLLYCFISPDTISNTPPSSKTRVFSERPIIFPSFSRSPSPPALTMTVSLKRNHHSISDVRRTRCSAAFQRLLLVLSCIDLFDCPVAVADDIDALGRSVGLDALKGVGSLNSLIFVHVRVVIVFYKLYG